MNTAAPRSAAEVAASGRPVTMGVLVALGTVYLVWGSTFLAIRYTVEGGLPPLLRALAGRDVTPARHHDQP